MGKETERNGRAAGCMLRSKHHVCVRLTDVMSPAQPAPGTGPFQLCSACSFQGGGYTHARPQHRGRPRMMCIDSYFVMVPDWAWDGLCVVPNSRDASATTQQQL